MLRQLVSGAAKRLSHVSSTRLSAALKCCRVALPCVALFACSAPESDNRSLRCSADLSCPDELMCYRGFCVDDGIDPSTGGPVSNEPVIDIADAGTSLPQREPGQASADAGNEGLGDSGAAGSAPSGSAGPGAAPEMLPGVDASVTGTASDPGQPDGAAEPAAPAVDTAAPSPVTPAQPTTPATPPAQPSNPAPPTPAPMTPAPPTPAPPTPAPPTPAPTTPTPAPTTPPVASGPCAEPCASASYDEKKCNQCVKDTYGESPGKLCKGPGEDDDDEEPAISLTLDPICASLCLGAARKSPTCIGLFARRGPAPGGEQP